jgi:hypothetical protein
MGKLREGTEHFPALWIEPDAVIVRPRRHDQTFFRKDTFGPNAVFHEPIERNDVISVTQAIKAPECGPCAARAALRGTVKVDRQEATL